jgi:DNA-directed RNA polymerase subunit RPC12/RpoP
MLVYSKERFIKAHEDVGNPYYNHSYSRYVRDVICTCGETIGEQDNYPDFNKGFSFDSSEKNKYNFCPYCGLKFYLQTNN